MNEPISNIFKSTIIFLSVFLFSFYYLSTSMFPLDFRSGVVKVYGNAGHGSGSIVKSTDKKSYILTNKHVCEGVNYSQEEINTLTRIKEDVSSCLLDPQGSRCSNAIQEYELFVKNIKHIGREVNIKFNNLKHSDIKGKVVKISSRADLCLIEINEGSLPTIKLARNQASPGDKITSIGNPLYMTNAQTEGYVGDEINYEGKPYQHHTGIIFGGNSGGPVVSSKRGELVGVNTLGTPQPTASYMIPLREIKKFLEE